MKKDEYKKIKMASNPLSEKIVRIGKHFSNFGLNLRKQSLGMIIIVDTLDGRSYGINTWTIESLDLFVKELSRECIEKQ